MVDNRIYKIISSLYSWNRHHLLSSWHCFIGAWSAKQQTTPDIEFWWSQGIAFQSLASMNVILSYYEIITVGQVRLLTATYCTKIRRAFPAIRACKFIVSCRSIPLALCSEATPAVIREPVRLEVIEEISDQQPMRAEAVASTASRRTMGKSFNQSISLRWDLGRIPKGVHRILRLDCVRRYCDYSHLCIMVRLRPPGFMVRIFTFMLLVWVTEYIHHGKEIRPERRFGSSRQYIAKMRHYCY